MIEYPLCGRIVNTHGCRGGVKIEAYCDSPEVLAGLPRIFLLKNGVYTPRRLLSARVHKGAVIAEIEGISDMTTAEGYKNTDIFADRSDLPLKEGSFLLCDLIGLPLVDAANGTVYGTVTEIESGDRYDLYTVKTEKGDVLFPAVREFIREIRPPEGIYVTPIEGLFE